LSSSNPYRSAVLCSASTDDFRTSRDDKRELAVLVGREPAGRGLSSPGTALALSAASLTGAASLTTVAVVNLLSFPRLGIVTCSADAVVDRRIRNDQFGQLISFISGYYVSDHAATLCCR
ncbi:hypothetical protein T06_14983, partial [Trichinella sp. T6]